MRYRLYEPSWPELQRWAARLRRLDDAAVAASTDKDAARRLRLADDERRQAATLAMPASWRVRDKLRAAPWPTIPRLWRALGASDAFLAPLTPAIDPAALVPAYCEGYLAIQGAYMMPDQHQPKPSIVAIAARSMDLDPATLGVYLTTGDVGDLSDKERAALLCALAKSVGVSALSKPFMIVDGKLYATATCASAIRIKNGLECSTISTDADELLGVKMVKCVAECSDPNTGRVERAEARVPWLVEHVTKWGTSSSGKRFPDEKEWQEPSPEEVANKIMKCQTKAERRATLKFAALGTSAAEDVPGSARMWAEPVQDGEGFDEDGVIDVPARASTSVTISAAISDTGFADLVEESKRLRVELARVSGTDVGVVWSKACEASECPRREPDRLTSSHLIRINMRLSVWTERKRAATDDPPEVIVAEVVERQPGEDLDVDAERNAP